MKIAMVQSADSLGSIFSEKAMGMLAKLGEVILNDGDASPEQVKKTVRGADIAVTSWGNKSFTKDILDCAPNLKLIAHAAGSIKPIVTDEVWERGIRVTGSPKPIGHGVAETALGLTITASKNFYQFSAGIHENGEWKNEREPRA